jgi:uncharacterized phiE125 gp8 family phage protein
MEHRSLVLNTAPATQIVSTADMKTYLQVDDATDDTEITEAIVASRQAIENYTGRSLINTVWNLWLDGWPRDKSAENPPEGVFNLPIDAFDKKLRFIKIPRAPLVSITSIKYYDTADAVATFSSGSYFVDTKSTPGRVCLNNGANWPTTLLRPCNGIDVKFTCGYGTATTDIPDAILLAVKQMVKFNYRVMTGGYEEGETLAFESDKNKSGLTDFVEKLLMPYRIVRF